MGKNVLVAMSGGVDSSVAADLLKQSDFRLTGVTMCLGVGAREDRPVCCGRYAIEDARKVCSTLDIPHLVVDMSDELEEKILRTFVTEYVSGRTPNPCVECNRYLKFGKLLEVAEALGFEYLANGHYALIDTRDGRLCLKRPHDRDKDQTYFLYPIAPGNLGRIFACVLQQSQFSLEPPCGACEKPTDACFAIVIVEKSSQARPCSDCAIAPSHLLLRTNDAATQSLVVSLEVVVLHVLFGRQAKVLLPKGDDFVQALGLDGQDRTFSEGVQIRTPCRQSVRIRTAILEHMSETDRVQRDPVHDELSSSSRHTLGGSPSGSTI